MPRAASLTALNEQLLEGCRRRLGDRLRGHDETIGERLVRDLAVFHDLPPAPYDACEKKCGVRRDHFTFRARKYAALPGDCSPIS